MNEYARKCPNCLLIKEGINNFFCIKNTGICEDCIEKKKGKTKQLKTVEEKEKELPDKFEHFRKMTRPDEKYIRKQKEKLVKCKKRVKLV